MIDGIDVAPQPWHGSGDGPGTQRARWHHVVELVTESGLGVHLIGFSSDEGVRRSRGRVGAASGPQELRRALGELSAPNVSVCDCGDVIVRGDDLEGAQERLGLAVNSVLMAGGLPIVLGGGSEASYGSYLGWAPQAGDVRWGVLNLDRHFDLRSEPQASASTPFLQMIIDEVDADRDVTYAAIGVSPSDNPRGAFDRAAELGVRFLTDADFSATVIGEFVDEFLASVDRVHLVLDLDVLPPYVAPGVSSPAGFGLDVNAVRLVVQVLAGSGKLGLIDVVEYSPELDIDQRTARVASRIVDEALRSLD